MINGHFDHMHMTAWPLTSLENWKMNKFLEWDAYTADFAYAVERLMLRDFPGVKIWAIGRKEFEPDDFYISVASRKRPNIHTHTFQPISHYLNDRQEGIEYMAKQSVRVLMEQLEVQLPGSKMFGRNQ